MKMGDVEEVGLKGNNSLYLFEKLSPPGYWLFITLVIFYRAETNFGEILVYEYFSKDSFRPSESAHFITKYFFITSYLV